MVNCAAVSGLVNNIFGETKNILACTKLQSFGVLTFLSLSHK